MEKTASNDFSFERRQLERILFFCVVTGVLLEGVLLAHPSEPENAWLLGYSKSRVLLAAGMAAAISVVLVLAFGARKKTAWFEAGLRNMQSFLSKRAENLAWVLLSLSGALAVFSSGLLVSFLPLHGDWAVLSIVLQRLRPVLLWLGVMVLSLLFLFTQPRASHVLWKQADRMGVGWRFSLVFFLLMLTFFQWAVMVFRLPLYTNLEGWFFYFRPRVDHEREGLFFLLLAGSLGLAALINRFRAQWYAFSVFVWMVWAYLLQLGFMWIEWGSFDRMVEKYILRYAAYANAIAKNPPFWEIIGNYEAVYGENLFTGTKPPGFMLLYWLLQNGSQFLAAQGLEIRLNHLVTFGFPLLAVLIVWPLNNLSRALLGEERAFSPALLYFSFPGVLLISLFPDQAVYPSLFVLVTWLAILLTERGRLADAIVLGGLLYLAIFLTFALLPLLFFVPALVWIHWMLFARTRAAFQRAALLTLGMGVGFASVYWFFQAILGYDAFLRYQQAMIAHALAKGYQARWETLPLTVIVNVLDFALGAGFAVPALWLVLTAVSLARVVRGRAERIDWVALAFWGMVVLLSVAAQTRSETARLWLFLLPVISVLTVDFFSRFFRSSWLYWFLFFQLWTTFFVYRFQRLY